MVKLTIVQILLTLITQYDLEVHQLDVKIVFSMATSMKKYIWKFEKDCTLPIIPTWFASF
jgi:hypothetical protein